MNDIANMVSGLGIMLPFVAAKRGVQWAWRSYFHDSHFCFAGSYYKYHRGWYMLDTERTVEVALAKAMLCDDVIEFGDVLRRHCRHRHPIVDMGESGERIITQDILTYTPDRKRKIAISLSTLEHTADPAKAVEIVKSSGHSCLITMPIGCSPKADEVMHGPGWRFMRRWSDSNLWRECSMEAAFRNQYNSRFPCANAIGVCLHDR